MVVSTMIIADSRGTGLQPLLIKLGHTDVRVVMHKGAGYEMSILRSMADIKLLKPKLVIVLSGVCDLTRRERSTRITHLRHNTVGENVEHVIGSAKSALDLLKSMGEHRITLATITGIDLADYNNPTRRHMTADVYRQHCTHEKVTHPQQATLNTAILEINRQITALNQSNATPTVWMGGVVHTHSKRKTYHCYIRLADGCHADEQTKSEWAKQIHRAIVRISHAPKAV